MIVLVVVAIGTGLATAIVLIPVNTVAALVAAPLVASISALVGGSVMAWLGARRDRRKRALDARTQAMVSALRDVTEQAHPTSPAPKVSRRRMGT